jgi:hypothetical protein
MAKSGTDGTDGWTAVVGALAVCAVVLLVLIPRQVWIGLGAVAAAGVLFAVVYKVFSAVGELNARLEGAPRAGPATGALGTEAPLRGGPGGAADGRADGLGSRNAAFVESAQAAVKRVLASEAARAGWLGDVDFSTDIQGVIDSFGKAHDLRQTADQLAVLDSPSPEDREILAAAERTAAEMERTAVERVKLIERCAAEAALIDESLRRERREARTARQRAELHAKLSAMLYGIEAAPDTATTNSAAEAVMARVQAYREIKDRIQLARGED